MYLHFVLTCFMCFNKITLQAELQHMRKLKFCMMIPLVIRDEVARSPSPHRSRDRYARITILCFYFSCRHKNFFPRKSLREKYSNLNSTMSRRKSRSEPFAIINNNNQKQTKQRPLESMNHETGMTENPSPLFS
uniref:Uncharacterized protein n=1 Tax=Cacopsylla melanoneura TaxID=428564 RepID=A0A8D9EA41_9HEMI